MAIPRDVSDEIEFDRLKDQFVQVAAHELKTPVTIMNGYAQALMAGATGRHVLLAIDHGADRTVAVHDCGIGIPADKQGHIFQRFYRALAVVAKHLPDLILLDMKMPVMNGWEFARAFHATFDHQVPIVVLTAADDARRRAEAIGADAWLGKPFDVADLLHVVKAQLQQRGAP